MSTISSGDSPATARCNLHGNKVVIITVKVNGMEVFNMNATNMVHKI